MPITRTSFQNSQPPRLTLRTQTAAAAIVEATTHHMDPKLIAEVSRGLGQAMRGIALEAIPAGERLAVRGW